MWNTNPKRLCNRPRNKHRNFLWRVALFRFAIYLPLPPKNTRVGMALLLRLPWDPDSASLRLGTIVRNRLRSHVVDLEEKTTGAGCRLNSPLRPSNGNGSPHIRIQGTDEIGVITLQDRLHWICCCTGVGYRSISQAEEERYFSHVIHACVGCNPLLRRDIVSVIPSGHSGSLHDTRYQKSRACEGNIRIWFGSRREEGSEPTSWR